MPGAWVAPFNPTPRPRIKMVRRKSPGTLAAFEVHGA